MYIDGYTHRDTKNPGHNIDEITNVPYLNAKLNALKASYKKDDTKARDAIEHEIKSQIPDGPQSNLGAKVM